MPIFGPILVFLANGIQGSAVVRAARQRGHRVRPLVRTPSADDPADAASADLDDPAGLAVAARGCAHAVLQLPTGERAAMVRWTGNAVEAFRSAGVHSIVLKLASASHPAPCVEPSFVANAAVEARVRAAGIPCSIVRPTLYLDNLLKPSARADIARHGIFAPPVARAQRIAWTCVDDCALAAILLLEQDLPGEDHCIGGPDSVTGDVLASRLSVGLGRPVAYHAQPLDAFEREVESAMGSGMGRRIASRFRYFHDHPADADRILAMASAPGSLPGFVPTGIAAWARQRRALFAAT